MQFFACSQCHQLIYFENSICLGCGSTLGFEPLKRQMFAIEPVANSEWCVVGDTAHRFRLCANGVNHQVCNWLVPAEDDNPLCRACRLNEWIPDLTVPGNPEAWARLERAKRRLLHGLLTLGLPIRSRTADPDHGIGFRFLADDFTSAVVTGHQDGMITLNIAEADDAERERRRQELGEPYRTLLGHFRHEIGHYYWALLIDHSHQLPAFRQLFGDERLDYGIALKNHYSHGAPQDWQQRFISAYAAMHPWEDWAESWAHYLHIRDTLETAAACGVAIDLPDRPARRLELDGETPEFDRVMEDWLMLTHVLNNLNRGLGLSDSYPFIISPVASNKLRFIHDAIRQVGGVG